VDLYDLIYQCDKNPRLLRLLPHIPLMWRLTAAENIILSGFQLELYAQHERTFAYWYLAQIIETHLGCIEDALAALPPGVLSVG
jgi:N-alpha-acetyltransferase 35, NatC auxiliary subunit